MKAQHHCGVRNEVGPLEPVGLVWLRHTGFPSQRHVGQHRIQPSPTANRSGQPSWKWVHQAASKASSNRVQHPPLEPLQPLCPPQPTLTTATPRLLVPGSPLQQLHGLAPRKLDGNTRAHMHMHTLVILRPGEDPSQPVHRSRSFSLCRHKKTSKHRPWLPTDLLLPKNL